jgi:hypothetical protein
MDTSYVRPEGGILHSHVATEDDFAAAYQRDVVREEDRVTTHNMALSAGYRALAAVRADGGLLNLSERLSGSVAAAATHSLSVAKALEEKIGGIAESYLANDGSFVKSFEKLAKSVGVQFDPNSEPMQKLREKMKHDYATQAKAAVDEVKALMNLADETSPVAKMHRDILSANVMMAQIKTQLDGFTALQQARRAPARAAGRALEDFVNDVIAPLASAHGETFDDVRDVPSKSNGRSKVGDFLTTLDGRLTRGTVAKLVIEAKNRKSGTVSALLRELDEAMAARGANTAIGILTNPNAKCRSITAYDGNKIIICLPGFGAPDCDYEHFAVLVELGYQYGRLLAVARVTMMPTESLDAQAIIDGVDEIEKSVKSFKELADNHTRIVTAVETAKATAIGIRDGVHAATKALRGTLESELERVQRKQLPPAA